jgi:FkbM family methyltransferase
VNRDVIEVKNCRHGRFMYYTTDLFIGRSMSLYGEWSEGEVTVWRQIIKPGWTVVDVGANIGVFTVPLANMVGPSGVVVAIEPQRQLFQMLNGNLALNEIMNVIAMHAALGEKAGRIKVPSIKYAAPGNFGGVELGEGGETVQMLTLDQILEGKAVDFIKIDVEGMEREVIAGGARTLSDKRPILFVENDRPDKSEDLVRSLIGMDYRLFWHPARIFNPQNFFGSTDNLFGKTCSFNMLCIHKAVAARISGLQEITNG